jgi:RNA polymerase sigma-70 factor (ECF subfamily)
VISFAERASAPAASPSSARRSKSEKSREEALHDHALVVRFNGGDESAFVEIVARHRTRLFAAAYALLRNRWDAEEIAQDACLRAHRGLAAFRDESSLATWLHHIALNLAHNRYWYFHRRFRHATVSLDHAISADNATSLIELLPCGAAGPAREAIIHEFSALVARCMTQLDENTRPILTLSHTLSYGEIATLLDINLGTVKSRIARARHTLRGLIATECPDFGPHADPVLWLEPAHGGQSELPRPAA